MRHTVAELCQLHLLYKRNVWQKPNKNVCDWLKLITKQCKTVIHTFHGVYYLR